MNMDYFEFKIENFGEQVFRLKFNRLHLDSIVEILQRHGFLFMDSIDNESESTNADDSIAVLSVRPTGSVDAGGAMSEIVRLFRPLGVDTNS